MLIRILYFIFLLVFIRFIVRLVRHVLRPAPRDPEPPRRARESGRGQRVIDVDYEEVKPGDKTKENTR